MKKTTDLNTLREQLEYYHRKLDIAERSKDPDPHYCSTCFSSQDPRFALRPSTCCQTAIINRSIAIRDLKALITTVRDDITDILQQQLTAGTTARPSEEVTRKPSPKQQPEQPTNEAEEGTITVVLPEGTTKTFPSPKIARRFLRDQNLTVKDALKEGSTWYFDRKE